MNAPATHRHSYLQNATNRRTLLRLAGGGAAALALGARLDFAAARQSTFSDGTQLGDGSFTGGTYAISENDYVYQYATGADGYAYYTEYDGAEWSGWKQAGETSVGWDPAPAYYDGASHAYYTGTDEYIYQVSWDTYGDAQWENVSGDYTFKAAPWATYDNDAVYLYGTASDNYVYSKSYSGDGWSDWQAVNEAPAHTDYKPYSVSWDGYENTFYLGEDNYLYWNRYSHADGTWTGEKQIPSDYTFTCGAYAIGYQPEESLYAYSANDQGTPVYNVFDGSAWSGWQPIEAEWSASSKYAPNAYSYNDAQHVVYVDESNHAYYTWYGADGWAEDGWYDLGDNYGYDSYQYSYDDELYLTYTGENGNIYYKAYGADSGGTVDPTPTEEGY
ncbi:MAG TPA: hypothetical protein VD767_07340 [Thermomicrobiales bacterium]|nr:hypothetical protein [Thermomicrobiales bacterium]